MNVITEIAGHQASFLRLVGDWNGMSRAERRTVWNRYTRLLDEGQAGRCRFTPVLDSVYANGWNPEEGLELDSDGLLAPANRHHEAA